MKDHVARFTTSSNYRIAIVRCSNTAQLIGSSQHKLSGQALAHFSDGIVAGLLFATQLKGNGVLSFEFDSNGPFDNYRCDATPLGFVRAMIPSSTFEKISSWDGQTPLIGEGNLYIGKKINQSKQPYQSVVKMISDNMTLNAIEYLKTSEQINGMIQLSTVVENDNVIKSDGLLIEEFPGTKDEDRVEMETQINALVNTNTIFQDFENDDMILKNLLGNISFNHIKDFDVNFACPCSEKRFLQNLATLSRDEINDLTDESQQIETECDFCKKIFRINTKQIFQIKNNLN